MKCNCCGSIIPDGSKECDFCGTIFETEADSEAKVESAATSEEAESSRQTDTQIEKGPEQNPDKAPEKPGGQTAGVQNGDSGSSKKTSEKPGESLGKSKNTQSGASQGTKTGKPKKKTKKKKSRTFLKGAILGLILGIAAYYKGEAITGIDFYGKFDDLGLLRIEEKINMLIGQVRGSADEENETGSEMESDASADSDHTYGFYVGDVSWTEAFQKCQENGGQLASFATEEEFEKVLTLISSMSEEDQAAAQGMVFFIGARREGGDTSYYWADDSNNLSGPALNTPESWAYSHWAGGEPTYTAGDTSETCLVLTYENGAWVLNDVPDNLVGLVPSYSGMVGYICEYGG